jgi:hypothetical protein
MEYHFGLLAVNRQLSMARPYGVRFLRDLRDCTFPSTSSVSVGR